jgi:hypothetical protein
MSVQVYAWAGGLSCIATVAIVLSDYHCNWCSGNYRAELNDICALTEVEGGLILRLATTNILISNYYVVYTLVMRQET